MAADGERRSTMRMLWDVLGRILAGAGEGAKSGAARTAGLLAGARRYLEDGHVTYMQNTIAANRAQARFAMPTPCAALCMSTFLVGAQAGSILKVIWMAPCSRFEGFRGRALCRNADWSGWDRAADS